MAYAYVNPIETVGILMTDGVMFELPGVEIIHAEAVRESEGRTIITFSFEAPESFWSYYEKPRELSDGLTKLIE